MAIRKGQSRRATARALLRARAPSTEQRSAVARRAPLSSACVVLLRRLEPHRGRIDESSLVQMLAGALRPVLQRKPGEPPCGVYTHQAVDHRCTSASVRALRIRSAPMTRAGGTHRHETLSHAYRSAASGQPTAKAMTLTVI